MKNKIIIILNILTLIFISNHIQSQNNYIDLRNFSLWHISSIPTKQINLFPESSLDGVKLGYNRAKILWYEIDPSVFYRNSSITPPNINISNHFVREIFNSEVYPNNQGGIPTSQTVFNLNYFPNEKGPNNYNVDSTNFCNGIDSMGNLKSPNKRWSGIMRTISTNIGSANVHYLGFWLMDPFVYSQNSIGGNLYFNIGNVSEDVLKDNKNSYENGLPAPNENIDTTVWGIVSNIVPSIYVFNDNDQIKQQQDVGIDGINNLKERIFFQNYLNLIKSYFGVNSTAYTKAFIDPSSDDYHFFRGSDYDNLQASIIERYKNYNQNEGNSLPYSMSPESYNIAATTKPDVEDLNNNFVLDTAENYFQYKIELKPESLIVGQNFITDKITVNPTNGDGTPVTWYKFLIPLNSNQKEIIGNISNLDNSNFIRIFLKNFSDTTFLRFFELAFVTNDLSVESNSFNESQISIYPNPNNGKLQILNNNYIESISIFDMLGRKVLNMSELQNVINPNIDISFLNNGIFTINIITTNSSLTQKILIQK